MLDKIVQGIGALTGGNFVSNLLQMLTSKIFESTKDAYISASTRSWRSGA